MTGHLFVIDGDLTKLACDAILIPTDESFKIEPEWRVIKSAHRAQIAELRREAPHSWGGHRTLHLDQRQKHPWVWLANVGQLGHRRSFADAFKPAVTEFVERAAKSLKADSRYRIHDWPIPRIAVNLIGSGRGGGSQRKGDLVGGLVRSLDCLAKDNGVDIVLVTFGAKQYAAAQRARRQLIGVDDDALEAHWPLTSPRRAELISCGRELASKAVRSHLVLFLGAGCSSGAGLPLWNALLGRLANSAGIPEESLRLLSEKDPRDQASIVESRMAKGGRSINELKNEVARELDSRYYTLLHGLLASLPSSEAVTTNFDCLFEAAWSTRGRQVTVLPGVSSVGGRWLLKLHGSVEEPEKIILTRSDYLDMPRRHGALMGLVQGMLMTRHMMFVGYSLRDEDFHELIYEVRAAVGDRADSSALATILTVHEDDLEEDLWGHDLHIVAMAGPKKNGVDPLAARQLEIFVDLVAYLSTTSLAFFLDETYDEISEGENDLRKTLRQLAFDTKDKAEDTVAFRVAQFLRDEFGADVTDVEPPITPTGSVGARGQAHPRRG
ncbi:SIR2 family NAD-dependent protein deacylase [Mycobacterium sp. NPDC051804]|uniref:SIR2 family NAD-dependent protein deacylase n=1 Tax=Mycobacterium sp. NPDC051804 TaxID=3364295 RepID=UPI003794A77F